MPHFHSNLAIGLQIKEFVFLKEVLAEDTHLNDLGVKVVNTKGMSFSLAGHRDCLQIVTQVVARVYAADKAKQYSVLLEQFDRSQVTCLDVMSKLQTFPDVLPSMRLVRDYPTLRPVLMANTTRLYGFAGEVREQEGERGQKRKVPGWGKMVPAFFYSLLFELSSLFLAFCVGIGVCVCVCLCLCACVRACFSARKGCGSRSPTVVRSRRAS